MKLDNYTVIQGWMCNELNLKGNELLIFAEIYGFCKDGESEFRGSRSYLAESFNLSLPTVDKCLKGLIEKNYIVKHEEIINNVKFNTYKINLGVVKKLYRGSKETLPNNIEDNNIPNSNIVNNNISNTSKLVTRVPEKGFGFLGSVKKEKKQSLYDKCVAIINDFVLRNECEYLRDKLIKYFNYLLDISKDRNIQFYSNNFKGKLNKLVEFPKEDWDLILDNTMKNGWINPYKVENHIKQFKEEDKEKQTRFIEELERDGKTVIF